MTISETTLPSPPALSFSLHGNLRCHIFTRVPGQVTQTDPYEPILISCLASKGIHIPSNSRDLGLWLVPLPADDSKPDLPLRLLIALAIYGSPSKALSQIYDALISQFSWFRTHNKEGTWKSSVRHSLSRNGKFVNLKQSRGRRGIWTSMA
ncbi:hypothetical protein R3P38DRAFT_348666 [Favolaschia claudopus]|uniref:Fork-head domain-containing protein n=1 Tax=Favolaschia claudopus TaxID=2862362 RepID=A0AAW0CN95_9AGAR